MTAFDDDPEYEAQLKDVLGDQLATWPENGDDDEMGELVGDMDTISEDSVLDDAPTFRMKLPHEAESSGNRIAREDDGSDLGERPMSEDARSVSTGDDSPSVQVCLEEEEVDDRGLRLLCLRLQRQANSITAMDIYLLPERFHRHGDLIFDNISDYRRFLHCLQGHLPRHPSTRECPRIPVMSPMSPI
jgi:hypothetical protein